MNELGLERHGAIVIEKDQYDAWPEQPKVSA